MTVQMFFVRPTSADDSTLESIADIVALRGGFVLMTTSDGSLIVAIDDEYADALRNSSLVDFASGVTLDLEGAAAEPLRRLFATNIATQLAARGWRPETGEVEDRFPPGYRPLRWTS